MKTMLAEDWIEVPSDVTCTVNARKVTIKGKRGEVTKDFSHIACELKRMNQSTKKRNGLFIRIRIWFGGAKQACAVNTLKSSIGNMVIGVTEGFRYKMRLVHAHFPINVVIPKDGSEITVKNFLGGKQDKIVKMKAGTTVKQSADVKGELIFDGIDNAALSQCCSQVKQVCRVGRKDERKFLDGIFVSQKTKIEPKEL
uniref:60S ribosomal protein L9 n=2 Tax=Choreotrichia TaxID=141411 RepID=A0A7S3I8E3_9SPIT|mmetsp:Transcript_5211/g.6954  ORF Transcript_5211/g.6954 Transcript_5211/m.6954 type:complete len:198 (+) Transcript_5211:88-681(+)